MPRRRKDPCICKECGEEFELYRGGEGDEWGLVLDVCRFCSGYFESNHEDGAKFSLPELDLSMVPGIKQDKKTNPMLEYNLGHKYDLSLDQYVSMHFVQKGMCNVCGRELGHPINNRNKIHVDHNHITGKVRGLLCGRCNSMISTVGDTAEAADRLMTHLGCKPGLSKASSDSWKKLDYWKTKAFVVEVE